MATSNKALWEQFESQVAFLLGAAGYTVTRNVNIAHQQVDILAIRHDLAHTTRIAVECKLLDDPMTKDQVAQVYAKYDSLYESNEIDEILIITKNGVTARTHDFLQRKRNLGHLTYSELQSSIMDFSTYLRHLSLAIDEDGLRKYYIPLKAVSYHNPGYSFDLMGHIRSWLAGSDGTPIALLAGYGTGKTTFARYLAATLAEEWAQDHTRRIPILLDLGLISDEQSLDGLLGKTMTTQFTVRNYAFDLFLELNRQGRFIVIFDSFDEMKHGISWSAFVRNMDEIKRLVRPFSRILICGRPSIFLDDKERMEALHDVHDIGGQALRATTFRGFQELSLQPFTQNEVYAFLSAYYEYLTECGHVTRGSADKAFRKLKDEPSASFFDLCKRPVQLKMVANILPEWNEPLNGLSRTILYDHFIDLLISRETKKLARSPIGRQERRRFARTLAWHMWKDTRRDYIRADDIPDPVLDIVTSAQIPNRSSRLRELVVGCSLEFKPPDLLYFPHRSIQEFLVAEKLIELMRVNAVTLEEVCATIDFEIADFLLGLANSKTLIEAAPVLLKYKGCLPPLFEKLYRENPDAWNYIVDQVESGAHGYWPGLFLFHSGYIGLDWSHTKKIEEVRGKPLDRLLRSGIYPYTLYGLHHIFRAAFPPPKEKSPDGKIVREIRKDCTMLLSSIRDLLKNEPFQKRNRESLACLSYVLDGVATYRGGRLELGKLRRILADYYLSTSYIPSMLIGERLSPEFDIAAVVVTTDTEQIEEFKSLRQKIGEGRF